MKIQHSVSKGKVMQYDDVTVNPIWWTAAILKIVFRLYLNDLLSDFGEIW